MVSAASSSPTGGGGGKQNVAAAAAPPNSPTNKASVSFASASPVVIPPLATAAERSPNSTMDSSGATITSSSPFLDALSHHRVQATVIDLDHYRIHGGMAVETDYIVHVQAISKSTNTTSEPEFDSFLISKTFSAFRTFGHELKKAADAWTVQQQQQQQQHGSSVNLDAVKIAKYCELISHLVESQRTQYMGKVNYRYVKTVLAKNRTALINNVLQATCANYVIPSSNEQRRVKDHHHALVSQVASIIETFFLTDHCCSDEPVAAVVAAAAAAATATSGSASGGGGSGGSGGSGSSSHYITSPHHIIGAAVGKIVNTAQDGVAAAAQKTRELTRGGSSNSNDGHHHRTGTTGSSNPLGWLPFMDNNKDKKEGVATVSPSAAAATTAQHEGDGTRTSGAGAAGARGSGGQRRMSLVVPLTRKDRRSELLRAHDEEDLSATCQDSARLLLDDSNGDDDAFLTKTNTTSPNKKLPSSQHNARSLQEQQSVVAFSFKMRKFLQRNPTIVLCCIFAVAIALLKQASLSKVIIDADMALLVIFACYCLGLHTPRPNMVSGGGAGVDGYDDGTKPPHMMLRRGSAGMGMLEDRSGRKLLARSMKAQRRNSTSAGSIMSGSGHPTSPVGTGASDASNSAHDNDDDCDDHDMDDPSHSGASYYGMGDIMGSPMSMFPVGAKIGSVTNCWGFSDYDDFQVRGATYLQDKQKVASGEYLFPVRGVDLFLTDMCPENVGSNAGIFGGNMRTVPTFVINFRLPWGVLVFYFEIPAKFVPYLQLCYEPDDVSTETKAQLMQDLNDMSAGERCAARFLMKDQSHKNQTFKIIPYVVNGPWVVRQVVGGKPALIGNKLPISWVYQSAENTTAVMSGSGAEQKACYLEADLDIAASSAARSILSVARTYCQVLTLDLGFVVQGNTEDELPEQMLVGCRLHGIDPLTSPSFPMSTHDNPLYDVAGGGSGDGSDDENSSHFGRTG